MTRSAVDKKLAKEMLNQIGVKATLKSIKIESIDSVDYVTNEWWIKVYNKDGYTHKNYSIIESVYEVKQYRTF